MTTLYITPEKVYALSLPPALLFQTDSLTVPSPLLPGSFSDCVRTAGSGTAPPPDLEGNPMGTFSLVIVCTVAGQCNQLGTVNPGVLPAFKLSVDGAVTFGRSRTISADDGRAFIDYVSGPVSGGASPVGGAIGIRLYAQPGLYAVGDTFTASTTPSPDLTSLIPPECDYADGFLVGSWGDTLPLLAWGGDLEQTVSDRVRWRMICKAGLGSSKDMEVYHPDKTGATKWYQRAQSGEFANHPAYRPSLKRGTGSPKTSFPQMVPAKDPLSGMWI